MTIPIGSVAREVRQAMGLSQEQMAERIGVSHVHVSNIEQGRRRPSEWILIRYREVCGIDLYMYACCRNTDLDKMPNKAMRDAVAALLAGWDQQLAAAREKWNG